MLRSLVSTVDKAALRLCERVPYLANWYYCINRQFEREHHAVIVGRLHYLSSLNNDSGIAHRYRLRRNTHRLEKGLISRPRRELFALDYIGETVVSYESLYASANTENRDELYNWSTSVLKAYFEAVQAAKDLRVEPLHERFCRVFSSEQAEEPRSPYHRDTKPLAISIDAMHELAHRRRSVRWYEQRPVPREIIDKAVVVAGYSPSACNRQPFEFLIFDDPEQIAKVSAAPMGVKGFNHQFPGFAVIVGKLHAYPYERDRHLIYIDASLAAMSFEYALEVQGVASCSINWPDIPAREKMIAKLLGLQSDERVIMCISFGFPDPTGMVPYSQKKSLNELRAYNRLELE